MGKGYNKGKKRLTGKEGEYEAWGADGFIVPEKRWAIRSGYGLQKE